MSLLSSYSEGSASEHQANRLGEYKLTGVLADRPIYKNEQGDEFLFYLRVRSWLFLMPMYIKQHNEENNDEFEEELDEERLVMMMNLIIRIILRARTRDSG